MKQSMELGWDSRRFSILKDDEECTAETSAYLAYLAVHPQKS